MIIDHEGTSSKYGHLCPLVDTCNAPLPQKALSEIEAVTTLFEYKNVYYYEINFEYMTLF